MKQGTGMVVAVAVAALAAGGGYWIGARKSGGEEGARVRAVRPGMGRMPAITRIGGSSNGSDTPIAGMGRSGSGAGVPIPVQSARVTAVGAPMKSVGA